MTTPICLCEPFGETYRSKKRYIEIKRVRNLRPVWSCLNSISVGYVVVLVAFEDNSHPLLID
jgi:hypothetical protein